MPRAQPRPPRPASLPPSRDARRRARRSPRLPARRPARRGSAGADPSVADSYTTDRTSGWRKLRIAPSVRTNPVFSAGSSASWGSSSSAAARSVTASSPASSAAAIEKRLPGGLRQPVDALGERRTEPCAVSGRAPGSGAWPSSCCVRERDRKLEERERVPRRLVEQPLADRRRRPRRALIEQQADADGRSRPATTSSSSPGASKRRRSPSRAPNTIATCSATSLRATNVSDCAEETSSHCASSTTHRIGLDSAAAASSDNAPAETRKRSRPSPGARPSAAASGSRCGSGTPSSSSTIGHSSPCNPANASSDSHSTPVTPRTIISAALPVAAA